MEIKRVIIARLIGDLDVFLTSRPEIIQNPNCYQLCPFFPHFRDILRCDVVFEMYVSNLNYFCGNLNVGYATPPH